MSGPPDPAPGSASSRVRPAHRQDVLAVLFLALVGALGLGALAWVNADAPGVHPANLVHPGREGPSADALRTDFPDHPLPPGLGHDGQQFYAVARGPFDLDTAARYLDRPRYRLQRMAFPVLAWAAHPGGGGEGLVRALFAVGVVSIFAGTAAAGFLSLRLGGSPLPALAFVLAPAAWLTLRLTLADNLALGAVLGAVALSLAGRHRWAVAAAVLAVLTKESMVLVLLGLALSVRDRPRLVLLGIPTAVAGAWWIALHGLVEDHSPGVVEFTWPFVGLLESASLWSEGRGPIARAVVPVTLVLGLWALARAGWRHPLAGALVLQLLFIPVLGPDVLSLDANGTRMTMPLLVLAVVMIATKGASSADVVPDAAETRPAPVHDPALSAPAAVRAAGP